MSRTAENSQKKKKEAFIRDFQVVINLISTIRSKWDGTQGRSTIYPASLLQFHVGNNKKK